MFLWHTLLAIIAKYGVLINERRDYHLPTKKGSAFPQCHGADNPLQGCTPSESYPPPDHTTLQGCAPSEPHPQGSTPRIIPSSRAIPPPEPYPPQDHTRSRAIPTLRDDTPSRAAAPPPKYNTEKCSKASSTGMHSCLHFALLGISINKIALWKNVRVDDQTVELVIIASNKIITIVHCPFNNTEKINVLSAMRTGVNCFFN